MISQLQNIEVLGTKFNIKAYKDEATSHTTLVEGEVLVRTADKKLTLRPDQQSTVNRLDTDIVVQTVDVYNEISWKNGIFAFKNKSLKDIMRVLSRWYDVHILFDNKEIENTLFTGVLSKKQRIEDILETIKITTNPISYEVFDKKIIMK